MPPSNAMENDKKRLRNQFTKDERTRLLAIMTEYGPFLDDKNISINSRKEIWEIIENKFNENGHSGRTSAQLKKYWQNYKYHSKRIKTIHKQVPKPLSPTTKQMVRMLAKVNPEEWAQYDVAVGAVPTKKSNPSPESSPTSTISVRKGDRLSAEGSSSTSKTCATPPGNFHKSVVEALLVSDSRPKQEKVNTRCDVGGSRKISESNVVVSTTDVPGSSVMVSVICPEVPSKGRTIFWKREIATEKIQPKLEPIYPNELDDRVVRERKSTNEFSPDVVNSDTCDDVTGGPRNGSQLGEHVKCNNSDRLAGNKSERCLVPKLTKSQIEAASRRQYRSGGVRNVVGVVEEKRLSKDYESMETSGSVFTTDGRNATTKTRTSEGVPNPLTSCKVTSRGNRRSVKCFGTGKGDVVDNSDLLRVLEDPSSAGENLKRTEILNGIREMTEDFDKFGDGGNFEADCAEEFDEDRGVDMTRLMMNRRENSLLQDLSYFELYMRLLRGDGQLEGDRNIETLRKMEPLISMLSLTDTGEGNDGASSDCERGMEVDECTTAESQAGGNLRVRRGSLMTSAADEDQTQREIKVEREVEPETSGTTLNASNDDPDDGRVMNTMNYLVQAKLQSIKSETDHQLKLQKLEIMEKELRVKIAEMAIQETRLRIQALVEDRQRATEIHELRLAQMAAEKARIEAEHRPRYVDATGKGRAN